MPARDPMRQQCQRQAEEEIDGLLGGIGSRLHGVVVDTAASVAKDEGWEASLKALDAITTAERAVWTARGHLIEHRVSELLWEASRRG
jgi:hypothetical protein